MTTPNGYNNPAYCHQYDSSLYDYQYVPEIDPDSPDPRDELDGCQTDLIHPDIERGFLEDSDENSESDESKGSIIIEECNNRRVTMICEKRSPSHRNGDYFYQGRDSKGIYYQDVSLESENGYVDGEQRTHVKPEVKSDETSLRHQKPLNPPAEQRNLDGLHMKYYTANNNDSKNYYQRPKRQHRYEEISGEEDYLDYESSKTSTPKNRYAEISLDQNGFPTMKNPIEIQKVDLNSTLGQSPQTKPIRVLSKPRAITPTEVLMSFSPPKTPSQSYFRNPHNQISDFGHLKSQSPGDTNISISPRKTNSFEMAELSPPRSLNLSKQYPTNDQTYFINSPKRQPPVGASPANEPQDFFLLNSRCILPTHLQKHTAKLKKERSHSVPNSPKRIRDSSRVVNSPSGKLPFDRKVKQIFHGKGDKVKTKTVSRDVRENPVRRNISNSFTDPPGEQGTPKGKLPYEPVARVTRSPYKPSSFETALPKTAVITPTFQRKNQQLEERELSPSRRDFLKTCQSFQSIGNLSRIPARDRVYPDNERRDFRSDTQFKLKRNQSVPNFVQTFKSENGMFPSKSIEPYLAENKKWHRSANLQRSPMKKTEENLSPINKSRLSLINRSRGSWSNADSEYYPQCSTCFIFATIIHLVTATVTCAIGFYLLSKMGRRYYLDFGIIAGFINFILGLLGFRSYCWRWLPNRNYVSGFIGLAAFSIFTSAGLSYLIIVKPMAGDPVLDIIGGAIGAVSVLTILIALTGLTMSGCCKSPPPDNRVSDL